MKCFAAEQALCRAKYEVLDSSPTPQGSLSARILRGVRYGAGFAAACLVVGALRSIVAVIGGARINWLSGGDARQIAAYVSGFLIAGVFLSLVWHWIKSRVSLYAAFAVAGIIAMTAIMAGEDKGLVGREPFDWWVTIALGILFGSAGAFGFSRRGSARSAT